MKTLERSYLMLQLQQCILDWQIQGIYAASAGVFQNKPRTPQQAFTNIKVQKHLVSGVAFMSIGTKLDRLLRTGAQHSAVTSSVVRLAVNWGLAMASSGVRLPYNALFFAPRDLEHLAYFASWWSLKITYKQISPIAEKNRTSRLQSPAGW